MKKTISLLLALALCLSLCACGSASTSGETETSAPEETETTAPKPVELTVDNIGDYLAFSGEFTESEYHQTILYYVSTSVIDFQAYATAAGSFDNVEITVRANISDSGAAGEKWHLADTDDSNVTFSFKMPASGNYSHAYSIECNRSTGKLKGSCEFTIVSVSGTFIPAA